MTKHYLFRIFMTFIVIVFQVCQLKAQEDIGFGNDGNRGIYFGIQEAF